MRRDFRLLLTLCATTLLIHPSSAIAAILQPPLLEASIQFAQSSPRESTPQTPATCSANTGINFDGFQSIVISPDGKSLISTFWAVNGVNSQFWDLANAREISFPYTLPSQFEESWEGLSELYFLKDMVLTPDGRTLVNVYDHGIYSRAFVKLYNLADGREIRTTRFDFDPQNKMRSHFPIKISPDGKTLAWLGSGEDSSTVVLWDIQTGRTIHTYTLNVSNLDVASIGINWRGQTLSMSKFDGTVDLLDLTTGRSIRSMNVGFALNTITLDTEGKFLFGAALKNSQIGIWDTTTARLLGVLKKHNTPINFLAFNSNNAILISGSDDGMIKLWEAPDRETHSFCINAELSQASGTAEYHEGRAMAFMRNSQYQEAIDEYTRAIELDPNYSQIYLGRGIAHRRIKDYQASLQDISTQLQLDPFGAAYYERGLTYLLLAEPQRALEDFTQTIDESSNTYEFTADAYFFRGLIFEDFGEKDKALEDLRQAVEIYRRLGLTDQPGYRDAVSAIGRLELR